MSFLAASALSATLILLTNYILFVRNVIRCKKQICLLLADWEWMTFGAMRWHLQVSGFVLDVSLRVLEKARVIESRKRRNVEPESIYFYENSECRLTREDK